MNAKITASVVLMLLVIGLCLMPGPLSAGRTLVCVLACCAQVFLSRPS